MTEEQARALGLRAVACRGWRWMPGMVDGRSGNRISHLCDVTHRPVLFELRERWDDDHMSAWGPTLLSDRAWPDVRDPATVGCLLALVREAHGAPLLQVSPVLEYRYHDDGAELVAAGWVVYHNLDKPEPRWHGATEAEALVAALEAAP